MNPSDQRSPQALHESVCSIDELARDTVVSIESQLEKQGVDVEFDLQALHTTADSRLVKVAISSLLLNALESLPLGGEITLTLLDDDYHWELEVADTSSGRFHPQQTNQPKASEVQETIDDLPVVIPFPGNDHLRAAHRAAMLHGGQVQSFDCPQGGMAHVLVIPKRRARRQAV